MGRRLAWIDAARVLCCGLVVLAHANEITRAGLETYWPGGVLLWPAVSATVPCFLVVSGYLAAHSMQRGAAHELKRIVAPLAVWTVVMAVLFRERDADASAGRLAYELLTGPAHLYFLFALLQLRLLHRLVREREASTRSALYAAAAAFSLAFYVLSDLTFWRGTLGYGDDMDPLLNKVCVGWAIFYVAGAWAAERPWICERLTRRLGLLALLTAAAFGAYIAELDLEQRTFGFHARRKFLLTALPFELLFSAVMLVGLRRMAQSRPLARLVGWIAEGGEDTFGIYLAHYALLMLAYSALQKSGLANAHWIEVPLLSVTVWLAGRGIVRLARRHTRGPLAWPGTIVFGMSREP